MTDAELQSWWPELGTLVAELRQIGQALVAESMLDALSGSTSGEILGDLGLSMRKHRTLRAQLSDIAMQAWDTIMADINKNYPVARLVEWIARMTNR